MGFGGEATLLGCKIGVMNRIPASFYRLCCLQLLGIPPLRCECEPRSGEINEWMYQDGELIDFAQRKRKKQRKKK